MEIPLFKSPEEESVLITPTQQIQNLVKNLNLDLKKFPKKCILAAMNPKRLEMALKDYNLKEEINSGLNPGAYPYKIYSNGEKDFVLAYAGGMGPSSMANTLELLIAMGIEEVYLIGLGGSLQKIDVGEIVIGDEAIRDEGVSYHYLEKSKKAKADKNLIKQIKAKLPEAHVGKVWTTDCMYRETHTKFLEYQKDNVLVVDLESAAAYAIAEFRKIKIVSCFVVSDILKIKDWRPSFNSELINKGVNKIIKAILE